MLRGDRIFRAGALFLEPGPPFAASTGAMDALEPVSLFLSRRIVRRLLGQIVGLDSYQVKYVEIPVEPLTCEGIIK